MLGEEGTAVLQIHAASKLTRRRALQILAAVPMMPMLSGCGNGGSTSASPSVPAPGTQTEAILGTAITIPYPLFGLNSGDNLAAFSSNTGFLSAVATLGPSILRYPGGNSSSWFDLSTGELLTNPTYPAVSSISSFASPPFTFSVLATLLAQSNASSTPHCSLRILSFQSNALNWAMSCICLA